MKKLSLLIILASFAFGVKAQNAEVVNAYNYQRYKEYDKAKISIDKAILDPKTGISAKTWYYRGLIYLDITVSEEANVQAVDKDAMEKSLESFIKSIELDVKKQYADDCKKKIIALLPYIANKGIKQYENKDYLEASKNLDKFVLLRKEYMGVNDTSFAFSTALASFYGKDYKSAVPFFDRAIGFGYDNFDAYYLLAQSHMALIDTNKALEVIAKGKEKFPSNKDLQLLEINIYLQKGQLNILTDKLVKSIELDPQNKQLHLILGSTYENIANPKDKDGKDLPKPKNSKELLNLAEKSYLTSLKLDSQLYDANFNLAALYFNQGAEIINKIKDLPASKSAEYDAGLAKSKAIFKKAIPYFEKALSINPTDLSVLNSLKESYVRIGDYTKSNEMKKRIEEINKKK